MEYLFFLVAVVIFLSVLFILEYFRAKKREKEFIKRLYENYGTLPEREITPERFVKIPSYYNKHREEGQIDDITWNDLGFDEIFKKINHTLSASGEEYLYYTLRNTTKGSDELEHMEELVRYFSEYADDRVRVQLLMNSLGFTGKYSLYDYLGQLDFLGKRSSKKIILCNLLFLPLLLMLLADVSIALCGMAALVVYNIVSYYKEHSEIAPYIISFAYIIRLINTGEQLSKLTMPIWGVHRLKVKEACKELRGIKRGSFWLMNASRGKTTGNPLDVIMDYIRMIFHVDILKFNQMLSQVRGRIADIDMLIGEIGYLETVIAVGAARVSMVQGYCIPVFTDENELSVEEAYHPLLEKPVKNSIDAKGGVLLTGSNASGKSTFLKTIAVNAVLAQTIHTCAAKAYLAPRYRIYSSMALRDDLAGGESYYIVEIKALKRILDAAETFEGRVLCFVDEVLRGTNTVERIAASTQILRSLADTNITCFAATHDIEVTDLLQDCYDNYHFEEEVRDGDIFFNYRLLSGKATTRNAIKLLEHMGYDAEIVQKASAQAARFVESGKWSNT